MEMSTDIRRWKQGLFRRHHGRAAQFVPQCVAVLYCVFVAHGHPAPKSTNSWQSKSSIWHDIYERVVYSVLCREFLVLERPCNILASLWRYTGHANMLRESSGRIWICVLGWLLPVGRGLLRN